MAEALKVVLSSNHLSLTLKISTSFFEAVFQDPKL